MSAGRRALRGVTLLEVLVATLIVSMVIVSASWATSTAASAKHLRTEEPAAAALLAREVHELALGLPSAPSGAPAATAFAGAVALDALDGARFAPAILACGEAAPDGADWAQESTVAVYDVSDPAAPLGAGYEPVEPGSGRIYRLTVQVRLRGAEKGTWWWWISP